MSRRKSPDPLGNSNTRQMLDELDVLMEKMLALPVNQVDESVATLPAPAAVAPPAAREAPRPAGDTSRRAEQAPGTFETQAQVLVGQLSILHSPATHQALPSPKTPARDDRASAAALAKVPAREDAALGSFSVVDTTSEFLPPLSSLAPAVAEIQLPAPRRFRLRFSLRPRPLLWINQGFDVLTQRLGLPGSWLRHTSGRALLGALGLVLLSVALTWWLKETLGWTWPWESVE
ncbi:MAG: hypothetical protein FJ271_06760 [Planctomycetes bacterium]|nr:hypothetical protein [Planctomycetota bacterium]